jgi:aminoglycoside phosphotransferase (APT) family kinase protein
VADVEEVEATNLQITHVFVDGDEITGVIDWSEAGQGDALFDLAVLTL